MNTDDIIRELIDGDRDPIDDADDIESENGLEDVAVYHRSPDGESVVCLVYSQYTQYRRDPDSPHSEFDIYEVEP
jgi:hypothetical protein